MGNVLKPTKVEIEFLTLMYNRFYDLYEKILHDDFFQNDARTRFYFSREIFSVYKELLEYEPIQYYLKYIKLSGRPPLESVISEDLFSFVRNIFAHFPLFDAWDDVFITKDLATWNKPGTIHKFLLKCIKIKIDGRGTVGYRIWSTSKKKMTYININFPETYNSNRIYLKDIVSEKEGLIFCISLMKQILDTQVKSNQEPDIHIMSQAYVPKLNK
jgi:hypothetical protein